MDSIIIIVHIVLALAIVGFVLMQQGKGADAGASFGSGASQTVFGSKGSGNFLSRTTSFLVAGFFVTSLLLGMYASNRAQQAQQIGLPSEEAVKQLQQDTPVVDEQDNVPAAEQPKVEEGTAQ